MNDLREEIGMLNGKNSKKQWEGILVRMAEDRLPRKVEAMIWPDHRKRVRLQLRWEDCIKRDV